MQAISFMTTTCDGGSVLIGAVRAATAFNAAEVFSEGHWVEVFGGNGGYSSAFRLNPEYQVHTCTTAAIQGLPTPNLP